MNNRNTFAAAALTGFTQSLRPGDVYDLDLIAKQAYELADAMLRVTSPENNDVFAQSQYMIEWLKKQVLEREETIARLQKQLTVVINDGVQDDLDVRVVARAVLAAIDVDGDSYAVPSMPDIARSLVAEIARLRLTDEEREAIESCIRDDEAATAYNRAGTLRELLRKLEGKR